MKLKYFKAVFVFTCLCTLLIACKQKDRSKSIVPIDLPYTFKTKKAEHLSIKAFNLNKEEKYDEAINAYQLAIKTEPDNPKLFFDLSNCYSNKKDMDNALFAIDSAIKLDSLNSNFYSNRGLIYWQLYKDEKAIDDYKKAISLDSGNYVIYSNLSIAYYTNKDLGYACNAFGKAKSLGLGSDHISNDRYLSKINKLCK